MRINPIGLGYGNLRQNKIEKNNSKIISNSIKASSNIAKLSLEQLQGIAVFLYQQQARGVSETATKMDLNSYKRDNAYTVGRNGS